MKHEFGVLNKNVVTVAADKTDCCCRGKSSTCSSCSFLCTALRLAVAVVYREHSTVVVYTVTVYFMNHVFINKQRSSVYQSPT